jgi:hypothetical protein
MWERNPNFKDISAVLAGKVDKKVDLRAILPSFSTAPSIHPSGVKYAVKRRID